MDPGTERLQIGEMLFFFLTHERRQRDVMPVLCQVSQDTVGFDLWTGIRRVRNDLGEEENVHVDLDHKLLPCLSPEFTLTLIARQTIKHAPGENT